MARSRKRSAARASADAPVAGEARLDGVLRDVLRASGIRKNGPVTMVSERWEEVVGAEVASHALVKGYQRGVLGVEVDSAPWLQELASFRREEILARLAEIVPEARVRELKFSVRG